MSPKHNLQEGNRYIKRGQTLFPSPSSVNIFNFFDLAPDGEVVTVLAKPGISSPKSSPSHLNMRVYSNALQTAPPQKTPYSKIYIHHVDP